MSFHASAAWARRFALHQVRRMLFMAQAHVADCPFEADCLRLLRKLRAAQAVELSHTALLRRMKMDTKSFGLLIGTLEQRGDVATSTRATATKTARVYRLARQAG